MAAEDLFNITVQISRPTRTSSGGGVFGIAGVAVESRSARLRPLNVREQLTADQESGALSHVLYVGAAADIVRDDIVNVVPDDGRRFEVLGVRDPSQPGSHREVDMLEMQRGAGA